MRTEPCDVTAGADGTTTLDEATLAVHRFHCLRTLFVGGYVAVALLSLLILRYVDDTMPAGQVLTLVSSIVGPAAVLLLLLHLYEQRGLSRSGDHALPLTLDVTYFLYLVPAGLTLAAVAYAYRMYTIDGSFLSTGWWAVIGALSLELLLALATARRLVSRHVAPRLPQFFGEVTHTRYRPPRRLPHTLPRLRPLAMKRPNWSLWEQDESFVRLRPRV